MLTMFGFNPKQTIRKSPLFVTLQLEFVRLPFFALSEFRRQFANVRISSWHTHCSLIFCPSLCRMPNKCPARSLTKKCCVTKVESINLIILLTLNTCLLPWWSWFGRSVVHPSTRHDISPAALAASSMKTIFCSKTNEVAVRRRLKKPGRRKTTSGCNWLARYICSRKPFSIVLCCRCLSCEWASITKEGSSWSVLRSVATFLFSRLIEKWLWRISPIINSLLFCHYF